MPLFYPKTACIYPSILQDTDDTCFYYDKSIQKEVTNMILLCFENLQSVY